MGKRWVSRRKLCRVCQSSDCAGVSEHYFPPSRGNS